MIATAFLLALAAPQSASYSDDEQSAEERRCLAEHGSEDLLTLRDCMGIVDAFNMPLGELERDINGRHPVDYFTLANRLFTEAGRKDDGVFWFYTWQLRHRILIGCHPDADPSGEPALFGALLATGMVDFNGHARTDPDKWAMIIDRVLEWDAANPDRFALNSDCPAARKVTRAGLEALGKDIHSRKSEMLAAPTGEIEE